VPPAAPQMPLARSLDFCHSTALKRFLKTSVLLVIGLFLLASGFNAALDGVGHCATQSSFTVYNEKGGVILAYDGDLAGCKAINKPVPVTAPVLFHRT